MPSNIELSNENINFPYQENKFAYKCFPVRNIRRFKPDNGGAWLVEYKAEKERQIESLKKTKTLKGKSAKAAPKKIQELTGFLLTKEFRLDEPSGLFSININGRQLYSVKDEDFSLFVNVLYIEAGDNHLEFETFKSFPRLEELHAEVNGISDINITHTDFLTLKRLDLSYNQLNDSALLNLGKLRKLKELILRGCSLKNLHPELARAYLVSTGDDDEALSNAERRSRFPELEHLDLSENKLTDLSTFASLAGLRRLKTLNLSSNKICGVPHLRLLVSHRHFSATTSCNCRTSPDVKIDSDVNKVVVEGSVANITKVKGELKLSDEVCDEKDGNVKLEGQESRPKSANAEKKPIKVLEESSESYVSDDKGVSSDVTKDSTTENEEVNMDDSIDMADDITLNDMTFGSDIDVGTLDDDGDDDVDDKDKDSELKESSTKLEAVNGVLANVGVGITNSERRNEDIIDEVSALNKGITLENNSPQDAKLEDSLVLDDTDIDFGLIDNLVIDNDIQNLIGAEDSVKSIESLERDLLSKDVDELLGTNVAKVMNFTLGNGFNEDVKFSVDDNNDDVPSSSDDDIINNMKSPFPSLKMLDLSKNLISEEDALLALTSWPALQDLKLWGNPLIDAFKGVPPVISYHLQKMCGITVHRKTPQADHTSCLIGPSIRKSAKAYRVKNKLPPIKRNNILMIEAQIQKAIEDKAEDKDPLIDDDQDKDSKETREPEVNVSDETIEIGKDTEGIFLTQVNEEDMLPTEEENTVPTLRPGEGTLIEPRYIGYEELLKIDETYESEADIPIPSTVCGSVQSLRHMLKNPLIFKEGNYNKKSRLNPEEPKKKARSLHSQIQKKNDKIEDALEVIRTKRTASQENLATVLDDFNANSGMKERFPEAKKIVKQLQDKYDKVRLESLRPISAAQAELSSMSTRADKHSQDLILMRMKQGRIGDLYSSPRSTSIPQSRNSLRKAPHTAPL